MASGEVSNGIAVPADPPEISVLLPSRGRPDLLTVALDSCATTLTSGRVEVILRLDDDDPLLADALIAARASGLPYLAIVGPRYGGYRSIGYFLAEAARLARAELLLGASDDLVFRTPGWDVAIRDAAQRFEGGPGVIAPNPVFNPYPDNIPFFAVTRAWVDVLGFVYDPRVFWGDLFTRDVARALDLLVRLPDVVIEHVWAYQRRAEAKAQEPDTEGAEYQALNRRCVDEAVARLRGQR